MLFSCTMQPTRFFVQHESGIGSYAHPFQGNKSLDFLLEGNRMTKDPQIFEQLLSLITAPNEKSFYYNAFIMFIYYIHIDIVIHFLSNIYISRFSLLYYPMLITQVSYYNVQIIYICNGVVT